MSNYVMTFKQYREYESGEKTLREIKRERKELNKLEEIATKIVENPRLRRMTVFAIAGLNYMSVAAADAAAATSKIDVAGNMFLGIVQGIGYWLCLIGCIMEILKCVMNGSSKDVGRIMLKYLLIFATLYLMPWAFDLIKGIFTDAPVEAAMEAINYVG